VEQTFPAHIAFQTFGGCCLRNRHHNSHLSAFIL
jgi:hypothetical protein